jgi:hypothetical protein
VLDAFIIDELRRREQGEREETIRPRLELPLDDRRPPPNNGNGDRRDEDDDDADRGVVIIDL